MREKKMKKLFNPVYVDPARRDLLKQLVAMGVIGTSGLLQSPGTHADENTKAEGTLNSKNTWREDPGYEGLRKAMLWKSNTSSRYPDVIVQAESEQEIIEALSFAQKNDLQVVCRCSGHNTAGSILRNGGMLLDLSFMSDITLDTDQMTASVQPGVRMSQFYDEIKDHDLMFPIAECHTVALGGYLLGGGVSPLGLHWGHGPACYSIISADIILGNGRKVSASKDENTDLYWAIRGVGPGFFGVVTRYNLQLYHHPESILKYTYTYPIENLPGVISILNDLQDSSHDRVTIDLALGHHPESPEQVVFNLTIKVFTDKNMASESEARSLIAQYIQGELPNTAISRQEEQLIQFPDLMHTPDRSVRTNTDNIWTDDAGALLAIVEHYKNKPPNSDLFLFLSHGRQAYDFKDNACYSSKGTHFLSTHMQWRDEKDDKANDQWYVEFNRILKPYGISHYINQTDNERHPDRIINCFTSENWQRLARLRKKHDPDNRFYTYLGFT
jgi:FAD/FMN-containing dehydrogenase